MARVRGRTTPGPTTCYACNTPAGRFANHSWTLYVTAGDFVARDCNLSDSDPQFSISSPSGQTYGVVSRRAS